MTTDQLLDLIEKRGLLTAEQAARVRGQVAKSSSPVSPKALAKHLVDKGLLTIAQAQSLLSVAAAAPKPAPKPVEEESDLGLAPLDDDPAPALPSDSLTLEELPTEELPAEPVSAPRRPAGKKPSQQTKAAEPSLLDELDDLSGSTPLAGSPLDLLSGAAALGAEGSPLLAPAKRKGLGSLFGSKEPRKRRPGESEFDSPLMLFGGGALVLLLIVGGLVYFLYTRGSGDEQFKLAEDDYRSGSYTQAISKYNEYLEKYPTHPSASMAKVHRGLARLRQATERTSDYGRALEVAGSVVNEISGEKEFSEAKTEFRSLLPDIAEGLAKEAANQQEPEAVKAKLEQAEKALAMVMNTSYIPQAQRPIQRVTAIRETMAIATRDLDRDAELAKTLTGINQAIEKQDISSAYELRKKLLKAYPDLADNERLAAAVQQIAVGEKGAVQIADGGTPAETDAAPSPVIAEVAIALRSQTGGGNGPPVAVLGPGALYGFDSASGQLLWRRFVGRDSLAPVAIDGGSESDLLVVDAGHHELLRLATTTGKVVWRQPLGEPISGVAVVGKQAVASTRGGKLFVVDLAKGGVLKLATLPQAARLPIATNPSTGKLYQVAEQSTIYVFSGDLSCLQAFYLGQETGTVAVPPLLLSKHLIVIENSGAKAAIIHVLELAEDGSIAGERQKLPVPGRVLSQPVIGDRKLVVATDDGHIKVLGVNPSNVEAPLAELASQPPSSRAQSSLRQLLVEHGNLWIADQRLMRYKVQSAAGRLAPAPLEDDYDAVAFDGPLQVVGSTLIHARRDSDSAGTIVSGIRLEDGSRLWETRVGCPIVGDLVERNSGALVMTADGQPVLIDGGALDEGAFNVPAGAGSATPVSISNQSLLNDGGIAYSSPGEARMLIVGRQGSAARTITAPDALACQPAALGKGIAAPTKVGQVFWLNPANGKPVAAPFQPQVSAGGSVTWTTPDASADGKDLVISDGSRVYRVALVRDPEPHLEALGTSEELTESITSPIATLGKFAFAANGSGSLNVFQLPELKLETPIDLEAEVAWGPRRIDNVILVATSADELFCIDDSAKVVWRKPLRFGPLVGATAFLGDAVVIASLTGHVEHLALASGETQASADVGQPLHSGPMLWDKHWLAATTDGAVLMFSLTKEPPTQPGGTGE